jgi:hypothetical protein
MVCRMVDCADVEEEEEERSLVVMLRPPRASLEPCGLQARDDCSNTTTSLPGLLKTFTCASAYPTPFVLLQRAISRVASAHSQQPGHGTPLSLPPEATPTPRCTTTLPILLVPRRHSSMGIRLS